MGYRACRHCTGREGKAGTGASQRYQDPGGKYMECDTGNGRVFNRILLDSAEQVLDKSCINGVLFKK